jgi:hypothetical protein
MYYTVQEQTAYLQGEFRKLSKSYRAKLVREAKVRIREEPSLANHNNFWSGLSPVQVIEAQYKAVQ